MKNFLKSLLKATTTALKVTGKAVIFGAKVIGNTIGSFMDHFGNRDGVGTAGQNNRRSNKEIYKEMYGKKAVQSEVKQEMSEAPTESLEVVEPTREEPSQASQLALMMDNMQSSNAEAIDIKAIEVQEQPRIKQNEVKTLTMKM